MRRIGRQRVYSTPRGFGYSRERMDSCACPFLHDRVIDPEGNASLNSGSQAPPASKLKSRFRANRVRLKFGYLNFNYFVGCANTSTTFHIKGASPINLIGVYVGMSQKSKKSIVSAVQKTIHRLIFWLTCSEKYDHR